MADSRFQLFKRVISALAAAVIVLGSGYIWGKTGFYAVCTVAIVIGIHEFARMAFTYWKLPDQVFHLFWIVATLFYASLIRLAEHRLLDFSLSCVAFLVGSLWLSRGKVTNEQLLPGMAMGSFGLIYCVLFPSYAIQIVTLSHGELWFVYLLLVVFFGDIFAYFGGRAFGKSKFMPLISPNKSWEGSLSGLFGSCLAGTLFVHFFLDHVPLLYVIPFSLLAGAVAQSGDLIMSLVKRVAHVKDTGSIMPGHGGILDRLDGLMICCPFVFAFALYMT